MVKLSVLNCSLQLPQVPAQNWMRPWMGGNLADQTTLAMRFTFCVTLDMNWSDQRAGFVKRAWPGVASSQPAEVGDQLWFSTAWTDTVTVLSSLSSYNKSLTFLHPRIP